MKNNTALSNFFRIIPVIIFISMLATSLKAADADTVNYGTWKVKDVASGNDLGLFITDSVEFIPNFKPGEALVRLYYTADIPTLKGQYAIAFNIKNFTGTGTYQLGKAEARWRNMSGTACGLETSDAGTIKILAYDSTKSLLPESLNLA